jgi:sugar phosphate isomerase/epimerase
MPHRILLGTIAIEPHRWRADLPPLVRASAWDNRARLAGFDGLELWQRHFTEADPAEQAALAALPAPLEIFNAYPSFADTPEASASRERSADAIRRTRARAVKFNLGTKPALRADYLRTFTAWAATLPPEITLLNECHGGDIADKPAAARALHDELALPNLALIVHAFSTEEDELRAWFDTFGPAIRHVHVQHRHADGLWRRLDAEPARNAARCRVLRELGFSGTLTVEFTDGVAWGRPDPAREESLEALFAATTADLAFLRQHL